jgi:DNA-binding NtrC family response regulator
MATPEIVIVDQENDQEVGSQLQAILRKDPGYRVILRDGCECDLRQLTERPPSLLILVFPTAKENAAKALATLRAYATSVPVLPVVNDDILLEFNDGNIGARDFLIMPLRETEVCMRVRRLAGGLQAVADTVQANDQLAQIVGEDPGVLALKRKLLMVAQFEPTVLLTGETGTGKERFARALHYLSGRAGGPFLPLNCGAIPLELFESELYGHHRGAFTGAFGIHPGFIAEAEGGTLYLDEIETLSLPSQVKLLRFLQDHTYYSVGSAKPRQANVWIIASTNAELSRKIKEGTFREDLFYRLAVVRLILPPLRERKTDIPLLAAHFWNVYGPKSGRIERQLSPQVLDVLCQNTWPGNVRELENMIQQIAVLTESDRIRPEDLPIQCSPIISKFEGHSFAQRKALAVQEFERNYVIELLRDHRGNITHAAREAKKDRRAFARLVKKYQIPRT